MFRIGEFIMHDNKKEGNNLTIYPWLPLPHVDVSFDDDAHVDASFDEPDDDPLHLLV